MALSAVQAYRLNRCSWLKEFRVSQRSDVNHFIAASRHAASADDLRGVMESITREMGFHSYALVQHVRRFSWNAKLFAISNFSRDWIDYYFERNLRSQDPVHLASYHTNAGFRFDEIAALIELTDQRRNILAEARRLEGISDGFCVPAHLPSEVNATCTFVVHNGAPLPVGNLLMAQLIGCFAYEAARQILGLQTGILPSPGLLTARQLECILLVGRGKTDWEIARLLGIKKDTVTAHLVEARRRYGVSRRAELAVHAIYRGDLALSDILN